MRFNVVQLAGLNQGAAVQRRDARPVSGKGRACSFANSAICASQPLTADKEKQECRTIMQNPIQIAGNRPRFELVPWIDVSLRVLKNQWSTSLDLPL